MVVDDDIKEVIEYFTAEMIRAFDLLDSAKGVDTSAQEDEWEEDDQEEDWEDTDWDDDY